MADGIKQKTRELRRLLLPLRADDWLILIFIFNMVGGCGAGVSDKCGGRSDSGALGLPRTDAAWSAAGHDNGNAVTPARGGSVSGECAVNAGHAASSSCWSRCLRDCGGERNTPPAPVLPAHPSLQALMSICQVHFWLMMRQERRYSTGVWTLCGGDTIRGWGSGGGWVSGCRGRSAVPEDSGGVMGLPRAAGAPSWP